MNINLPTKKNGWKKFIMAELAAAPGAFINLFAFIGIALIVFRGG